MVSLPLGDSGFTMVSVEDFSTNDPIFIDSTVNAILGILPTGDQKLQIWGILGKMNTRVASYFGVEKGSRVLIHNQMLQSWFPMWVDVVSQSKHHRFGG